MSTTLWLENPPRRKARAKKRGSSRKRKPPGRFKTWAAWSKAMQAKRRKATGNPKKRASSARRPARKTTTRKTGARKVATAKKTTRRRRTYRRNPKLTVKRLMKTTTDGAINAGLVTVGQLASSTIPAKIEAARIADGKPPLDAWLKIGVEAAVAVAVGAVADMTLTARRAEMILAGALSAPLRSAVVALNIPVVSEQLAGVGSYPRARIVARNGVAGVGSYANRPRLNGVGSYPRTSLGLIPQEYVTGPPGLPTSYPGTGLGDAGSMIAYQGWGDED